MATTTKPPQAQQASSTGTTTAQDPTLKMPAALEEDDEFEDFPVEDWPIEETAEAQKDANAHLWEESWDDDDTNEDFAKELRAELEKTKKAGGGGK
ncbi:hypothetical protein MMC25_007880 [Agyrium rufum]|nr:hypothetical protein [Agyrium rufum]